jgi:ferrous iron transport protein B
VLEPVMRHIGFDWHISSALVGAFAAKEIFVSQLAILAAVEGDKPLRQVLQERYTPLQGYVLMLFCLMATPCVATFATVRKEIDPCRYSARCMIFLPVFDVHFYTQRHK